MYAKSMLPNFYEQIVYLFRMLKSLYLVHCTLLVIICKNLKKIIKESFVSTNLVYGCLCNFIFFTKEYLTYFTYFMYFCICICASIFSHIYMYLS